MNLHKIYSVGNQNLSGEYSYSYCVLEKDKKFLDWLGELLLQVLKLDYGKNNAKYVTIEPYCENKFEEETYLKEIKKMVDIHEVYLNKLGDRIDLFYGNKKVYLTLRSSKEVRKAFGKFVDKTRKGIKITSKKSHMSSYLKKVKSIKNS